MPLCASINMCLVVTCWERADLLALVCGVKLWVCHFLIGILGQVCYLIVSIPDLTFVCNVWSPLTFCIIYSIAIISMAEWIGCFTLIVFLVACDCYCSAALSHGANTIYLFSVKHITMFIAYTLTYINVVKTLIVVIVTVLRLFLTVPWVGLKCLIITYFLCHL